MGEGGIGLLRGQSGAAMPGLGQAATGVPAGAARIAPRTSANPPAMGGALRQDNTDGIYSLSGVYFNRSRFGSVADCLTAASAQGLPLDVCR